MLQYLKVMTNMPIGHPFRRPAVWGELPHPLLLAPLAKGRSYVWSVTGLLPPPPIPNGT